MRPLWHTYARGLLYKFQSFEDKYSIENLRYGQIWFSKPEGLNDPFDCAVPTNFIGFDNQEEMAKFLENYSFKKLREEGKLELVQKIKSQHLPNGKPDQELLILAEKTFREWSQQRPNDFSRLGVACFTTNLKNIQMWSHYANGHKGFCLEFDTNLLPFHERLHKVIYSNSYPTLSPLAMAEPESSKRLNEPLYTKSKKWQYEKEWRWIKREGNSAFAYDPKALTAIYFGCSALKENIEKITTMPAKSAPRLYQMQRSK